MEMVFPLTAAAARVEFLRRVFVRSLMRSSLETPEGIFEIRKVRAVAPEVSA